jgi:hypothetical protein
MATIFQHRHDTSTNWTSANPTLAAGEFGYETNTHNFKIGDGTTAWNSLAYTAIITPPAWTPLTATTDFATTAASTSTITMNVDKTATIIVGTPIKFTLSGTEYWAICTAITASLLTIGGAPLTTSAGALTALSYGDNTRVVQLTIAIPGYYEETSYTTAPFALESLLFMRYGILWKYSKAYLVQFSCIHRVADTGTPPQINIMVDGTAVCTTNSGGGLSMPTNNTSSVSTVVDITTGGTYRIQNGEFIEVKITKGTDTVKAQDLTITVVFVLH